MSISSILKAYPNGITWHHYVFTDKDAKIHHVPCLVAPAPAGAVGGAGFTQLFEQRTGSLLFQLAKNVFVWYDNYIIYIHIYIYICTYIYTQIVNLLYVYLINHTCAHIYHFFIYIYIYICHLIDKAYIYIHVCVCISMIHYIYIYVYTYTCNKSCVWLTTVIDMK